jgi:hypothetical protein
LAFCDLSSGAPVIHDSENLILDTQRPQVFNFDAILVDFGGMPGFYSSTEEGLLWQGKIDGDQLVVTGVKRIAPDGGAILREDSQGDMFWLPRLTKFGCLRLDNGNDLQFSSHAQIQLVAFTFC